MRSERLAVRSNQNCRACFPLLPEDLDHQLFSGGVDLAGGFVGQQHRRIGREGNGEAGARRFTAGESSCAREPARSSR